MKRMVLYDSKGWGVLHRMIYCLILCGMLLSCSTAKNTAVRRGFHQMKVKYNIYFNGNTAFLEGQQAIINANEDDYTQILNLYPVSNHKAAESSASQMDVTIEKCRKCIKLHSIQVKPKINPRKRNDPKYKLWLEQKEFNNQMGNAWLRLGEAEFHKGDFVGSIGTFSYVAKHYENDLDVVTRCQLWMARAYSELGWEYEADDMLNKAKVDNLNRRNTPFYSAVSADILLKKKSYSAAIPFIKKAIVAEKRNLYRPRFQYVLGQLYELEGKKTEAVAAYKKVVRMTPPIDMDFNARIKLVKLNPKKSTRKLRTMLHQSKYADKLEVIYGALGDVFLEKGDTAIALENYHIAIDTCTQANYNKANILIKAGDIYYTRKSYRQAQPCYKEAINIITAGHDDYDRVSKLAESLDELIAEYETIQLQDSLQRLSKLSPEEQRKVAETIVENLNRKEQADKEKAKQDERNNQNRNIKSVDTQKMFGDKNGNNSWYFYNDQLVRSGKSAFQNKWGNRQLEDNWRRTSKSSTSSSVFDQGLQEEDVENQSNSIGALDNKKDAAAVAVNDVHQPEFYLQQIPKNQRDIANSDSLIKNALFEMIFTYQDKIEDDDAAGKTFDEYCRRFPNDEKLPDLYFMLYMNCIKRGDTAKAEKYKNSLLVQFPQSKQAKVLSNPDYINVLRRTVEQQDSLYEKTYNAFKQSQFKEVKQNTQYAVTNFSMSPLIPNFLFLDAIATARTEGQKAFIEKLQRLLEDYPNSEPSAMAKTFLSLINEGRKAKTGALDNNLDNLRTVREDESQKLSNLQDNFEKQTNLPSMVVFVTQNTDEKTLNNLLYEIALFNFSQFLIKDFDIKVSPIFGDKSAVRVYGLENINEAKWYKDLIVKNEQLGNFIKTNAVQVFLVTEENFKLINTKFTLEEYLQFYKKL